MRPNARRASRAVTAHVAALVGAVVFSSGAFLSPCYAASVAELGAAAPSPLPGPSPLAVLSPGDAQRYAQAFAAMRRGDLIAGQNGERGLVDPCLLGRLEAVRLLHPAYQASYAELSAWLDRYADLPEAPRIYDLAMKRRPSHAPPPHAAATTDIASASAPLLATNSSGPGHTSNPRQEAARAAFYRGDVDRAYALAAASGERWIAGLAALRLKRYPDALRNLSAQAQDPRQSPWSRSAASFWAARAETALNDPARARDLLKLAARSPDTFYGLIAQRELDQQDAKTPQAGALGADPIAEVLDAAAVDAHAVADLARTNARAHRAAALVQIGLSAEAGEELRTALASAAPGDRPALTSLALALNTPMAARADVAEAGWARFDLGHFPTPMLTPQGGFIIDKALVYALVLQESQFNPNTISGSGAYGLMQLTAATAARLAGDEGLRRNPGALRDPALNLRLGQAYVAKLLAGMKGDVVRTVAAYNCGPGVLQRMTAKMGQDVDSLLMIESLPSGQTRSYVQRVMAGYWIYRQIFGLDSKTLDAAAAGTRTLAAADR